MIAASRPNVLIRRGVPDQQEMARIRVSLDELISEIRQAGIPSIAEVDYAILEQNGKITVVKKQLYSPATLNDLGIKAKECGIPHIIIADGRIDKHGLGQVKKDTGWLEAYLRARKLSLSEVYLMTVDDSDTINIIKRKDLAP